MQDSYAALAARVITTAAKAADADRCESCTGGMVAASPEISGASAVLDRGFVTYSNAAKSDLLGVAEATLVAHGAVSGETAAEMAAGALAAAPPAIWLWQSPVLPARAVVALKNLWGWSGLVWR